MINMVKELSALHGVSGNESAVRRYLIEKLNQSPVEKTLTTDRLGNLIVYLKGRQSGKNRVMFAAHMDEVGGMVSGITEDGYLRFVTVGGVNPAVLFARRVWINGHIGVIGGKAVHQCSSEEKEKLPEISQMVIDIGADTAEQARTIAAVGDEIVFCGDYTPLGSNRFKSKALDDRAGCAMLLSLAMKQPEYDIVIAFTVQEEVGLRGATTAAFAVQPDIAVVVDATTAADTAGVPTAKQVCRVGNGAVVSFMDRATLYDKPLFDFILTSAKEQGILAQPKTMASGGNDAGAIQTTGAGVRVAAISLPCRYLHSPSCVLSETDINETTALLQYLMNVLPMWDGDL